MSEFSGSVRIGDFNDYIKMGASCIYDKPASKAETAEKKKSMGSARIQLELDVPDRGHFNQIRTDKTTKAAKITLSDCLACSGCVTSAETLLITQQSSSELAKHLNVAGRLVVLTLSPQSRASLAVHFGLDELRAAQKLTTFFKSIGVHHVLDAACSLDIALIEAREEFVSRFRSKSRLPVLASECPGWICYAEKKAERSLPYISTTKSPQQIMGTIVKRFLAKKWGVSPASIFHVAIMPCYDKKLEASRDEFFSEEHKTRDVDCVLSTAEVQELIVEHKVDLTTLEDAKLDAELLFNVSSDGRSLLSAADVGGSGGYAENIMRYAAAKLFPTATDCKIVRNFVRAKGKDYEEIRLQVEGKTALTFARMYGQQNLMKLTKMIDDQEKAKASAAGAGAGAGAGAEAAGSAGGAGGAGVRAAALRRNSKGDLVDADGDVDVESSAAVVVRSSRPRRVVGGGGASSVAAAGAGAGAATRLCPYDYVEVMACPSGCLNGGGQIRAGAGPGDIIAQRELVKTLVAVTGADVPAAASAAASSGEVKAHTDADVAMAAGSGSSSGSTAARPAAVRRVRDPSESAIVQALYREHLSGGSAKPQSASESKLAAGDSKAAGSGAASGSGSSSESGGPYSAAARAVLHTTYTGVEARKQRDPDRAAAEAAAALVAKW